MPVFCRDVLPWPKVSVLRSRGLAFIRSSLLQLKLHCPGITSEDVRKSDLMAELTGVMSDGIYSRFVDIVWDMIRYNIYLLTAIG